MSTTIICKNCSYRFSDILIMDQKKPMEHKFKIRSIDDMNVRVIRSSTATVELPELGIKIEPASAAEAYISNIEGVLVRVIDAVQTALDFSNEPEKKELGKKLLEQLSDLRSGQSEASIIIKDPMGNSGIVSDRTEVRELTPEEANILETGMTIIDLNSNKTKLLD